MPLPPSSPSTERSLARERQRGGGLERRFPAARTQQVVFDGLGTVLTPGVKGDLAIHFNARITRWRLLADQPGDIVVDIWKTDYAGFPPTVADTITAAEQPSLSGSDKDESTSLTDWDVIVHAGDTLRFHIDSASTVTRVTLLLTLVA